jgi:hypothetical protein
VTRPLDLQERIAILIIIVVVIGTIGRQFDFPGRQGGVGVRDVHVPQPRATDQLRHVFLHTPRRPLLTDVFACSSVCALTVIDDRLVFKI